MNGDKITIAKEEIRKKIESNVLLTDDEERFYMVEMLGIPKDEAERMIARRKTKPDIIND